MNIQVSIQPGTDVSNASLPRVKPIVEVNYLRDITDDDDNTKNLVPSSVRLELDQNLKGSVTLEDADPGWLEANILSVDRSSMLKKTFTGAIDGRAQFTLHADDISAIGAVRQAVPRDEVPVMVVRTARLVSTGIVRVKFERSSIAVVPVHSMEELSNSNVNTFLTVNVMQNSSLEVTPQTMATLGTLSWKPVHLAIDGTFVAWFIKQKSIGWLWWLSGDRNVLGFVPDDLDAAKGKLVIALPVLSRGADMSSSDDACRCHESAPKDVTEVEVANNPDVYTEDPGAFCRPFSNPERVLSERSFAVIARVSQPEIGPMSSVNSKTLKLLNFDSTVVPVNPSGTRPASLRGRLLDLFRRDTSGDTDDSLVVPTNSSANLAPARHSLASRYIDLLKRLPSGRAKMDAKNPLQWEDDIAQYQATSVSIGHILEFRVRWRSNGYSLGTVAKTLTLAPRQTKRIQKIEWERSERAIRRERTQLRDQENDSLVRERDYNDSVSANLSEWASGGSESSTRAAAGGIGFFFSGIIGGVGGGAASANSSSHQEGGRETTASEQQRLRDAIRRHGDALRKFESTVVNEVTQEETVSGTTEVIRNPNYAHSLTVIYYQILRHLKVTTEFSGVRECIFVPFAIKPFDLQRAYRWRESLQAYIRSPLYSRALRYLKDVATNFSTSDILPGSRSVQQLTYVRGSAYLSLGIERPRDTAESQFDINMWQVAQPILDTPALEIYSVVGALSPAQRDRIFQRDYAPGMAAKWANKIQLRAGSRTLQADCTLASRYQFNRSVRIDFVVSGTELTGLSRQSLQQITVVSGQGLPPGSVANLTRLSLTYNTDRFEHSIDTRTGTNDLVSPATGNNDSATVVLPLDNWERVDEQLEIRRSVNQLIEHLNEHVEYYHKAIWWRMDRDRLLMMLDGFYVPNTNNVSIASIVDREPVGIIGNNLVFRVGAASFLGYGMVTTPAELYNVYAPMEPVTDPMLISLPTDGLYAQTIMDECAALEEHYGNMDWVLNDKEPDLGTIDPGLLQSRASDQASATQPTPFPSTIINLQNAPDAPAPSGLAGVLNAVTNPNAFRDMAGLAGTQANAQAALNTAANLATNFGNQAAALQLAKMAKAQEATRTADQKIASIKGAFDKGLSNAQDAAAATREVLAAMNPDSPRGEAPHENSAINAVIDTAKNVAGSTIEAATGEGSVKVTTGRGPLLASLGETKIICSFWDANLKPVKETDIRGAIGRAAEEERSFWFDSSGNAIDESANSQYGHLVRYWLARESDIPPLILSALQNKAVDGTINYGDFHVITSKTLTAAETRTLNAEAVRIRTDLIAAVPGSVPVFVNDKVEKAVKVAREYGVLQPAADRLAWSAIFIVATIRKAAMRQVLEAEVEGVHVGKEVLLQSHEGHRKYVLEAFKRKAAGTTETYHSFKISEQVVLVGDIIVQDRQAKKIENVWTYEQIPDFERKGRALHCDIVVDVPVGAGYVVAIGGNLGGSSRKRRYPVDSDGKLIVSLEQNYTQESSNGVLNPIPAPKPTATATSDFSKRGNTSTGRIFAILSLVPTCITVPVRDKSGDRFA